MDYPLARIVWITDLDFEIVPQLSASDLVRFMVYSPEYHAAQELWRERNEAAGTFERDTSTRFVLRPGSSLVRDTKAGGPIDLA